MSLENYVMDVFHGNIPKKNFTPNVSLEFDKILADLDWHLAFVAPRAYAPYSVDIKVYSIKNENSILGLGIYVLKEEHPLLGRSYYSLHIQVAASTEERAKAIREQSKKAIDGLMSRLEVEDKTFNSVIAPRMVDFS